MSTMATIVILAAAFALAAVLLLYWQRTTRLRQWLQRQLASGAWRLEQCPHCRGRGRCPQCGGMGTLGLMGKPCPACGGGEQEQGGRTVTVRGSGRCPVCAGHAQVYRVVASGATVLPNDEAIEAFRASPE
jgi:hypothetical protein